MVEKQWPDDFNCIFLHIAGFHSLDSFLSWELMPWKPCVLGGGAVLYYSTAHSPPAMYGESAYYSCQSIHFSEERNSIETSRNTEVAIPAGLYQVKIIIFPPDLCSR